MTRVVRLRFDAPADVERWNEYIDRRDDVHCVDLPAWRPLFRELYGIEDHTFACLDGDSVRGVLSLYHLRSPFMGKMLLTCPWFGYGGFYWDDSAARDALLEQAWTTARERRVDFIELRLRESLPEPYGTNTDFSEFNLELDETPEKTWTSRLASNVRQNVRKSRTHDLEFRLSDDHGPCWNLLRHTLRAHGTPFHGERFFHLLKTHLGDRVRFSEVRHGERVVAAGIVIRFRDTIITPYIGSLADSRALRSNYLQYWSLIEHYQAEGVTRFEMGRSPRGSTHARFKQKWGCEELPLLYGYRVSNPRKQYATVSRPALLQRLAVATWKRMPLAMTTAIGPRLFRYIP